METAHGISIAPATVRMALVEGEIANGVAVDEENVERTGAGGPATRHRPDQVIAAILRTRPGAAESSYQPPSSGITFTDPAEAAALRDGRSMGSRTSIAPASQPRRVW